jgi:tRNA G18 (ribose-2'-O)-methylase SpoU
LNIVPIHAADDPRVTIYRNQRDAWLRARATGGTGLDAAGDSAGPGAPGLFMAEGELVVRALIESPYPVESVLITPTRLRTLRDALARLDPAVPIYLAERPLLAEIVGFDLHRGVLAAGRRDGGPSAEEVIGACRRLLVMEDLANHDNVGGLLRSLAALGGDGAGALLSPRTCDPLYRKALRVSMGHALRLPIATLAPWPERLGRLREAGWRVIALAPGAEPLPRGMGAEQGGAGEAGGGPAVGRIALLLGAEGTGLTREALAMADERRSIAMAPGVDSLNVTVAASIAMWALWG